MERRTFALAAGSLLVLRLLSRGVGQRPSKGYRCRFDPPGSGCARLRQSEWGRRGRGLHRLQPPLLQGGRAQSGSAGSGRRGCPPRSQGLADPDERLPLWRPPRVGSSVQRRVRHGTPRAHGHPWGQDCAAADAGELSASGIDMEALQVDLRRHAEEIDALLIRNAAQATSLGLAGTPSYLIGNLLYNTLDYAGFRRAVANARRQTAPKDST